MSAKNIVEMVEMRPQSASRKPHFGMVAACCLAAGECFAITAERGSNEANGLEETKRDGKEKEAASAFSRHHSTGGAGSQPQFALSVSLTTLGVIASSLAGCLTLHSG